MDETDWNWDAISAISSAAAVVLALTLALLSWTGERRRQRARARTLRPRLILDVIQVHNGIDYALRFQKQQSPNRQIIKLPDSSASALRELTALSCEFDALEPVEANALIAAIVAATPQLGRRMLASRAQTALPMLAAVRECLSKHEIVVPRSLTTRLHYAARRFRIWLCTPIGGGWSKRPV